MQTTEDCILIYTNSDGSKLAIEVYMNINIVIRNYLAGRLTEIFCAHKGT